MIWLCERDGSIKRTEVVEHHVRRLLVQVTGKHAGRARERQGSGAVNKPT